MKNQTLLPRHAPSNSAVALSVLAAALLRPVTARAQTMCPMCGSGLGMGLMWLIGLATVAALVALTIYLVRRSRPGM